MLNRFKNWNKATKTAVLCAFVLTMIVFSKLSVDGVHTYKEWQAEQARIAKVEAEQRAMAEAEARKLRQEVEKTTINLNEALSSVQGSENPSDWVSKFQDAWDNDIKIVKRGSRNGWAVISAGPDSTFDTFDDIKREDSSFSITGSLFGRDDEEIKPEVEPAAASDEVEPETKKWWQF